MGRRSQSWRSAVALVGALLCACVATPLPTPPSANPQRMSLTDHGDGTVDVEGAAGAIEGDLDALRVTSTRAWDEVTVADDGSFTVAGLLAARDDLFLLEAVTPDDDVFLLAVSPAGGTSVSIADEGPDADMDGSPDAVDCDPGDAAVGGRRCPSMCVAETCNGFDDDCNGLIDEGCPFDWDGDGSTDDLDCNDFDATVFPGATEVCNGLDDNCDGMIDVGCACTSDADCPGGQTCQRGTCLP